MTTARNCQRCTSPIEGCGSWQAKLCVDCWSYAMHAAITRPVTEVAREFGVSGSTLILKLQRVGVDYCGKR